MLGSRDDAADAGTIVDSIVFVDSGGSIGTIMGRRGSCPKLRARDDVNGGGTS